MQHLWCSWNLCHCRGLFTSPGWTDASFLLIAPAPVPSIALRTPVPHLELEGIGWDSLAFLWIPFQLPHLLTKRCIPRIFIITIEKLIIYIRVRVDFVSFGMTITLFSFGFNYAFHSKNFYKLLCFKANLLWSPIQLYNFWHSYDTIQTEDSFLFKNIYWLHLPTVLFTI